MRLIFIVSQPRSGSTLLQRIISNSPEVATRSEPWICLHLGKLLSLEHKGGCLYDDNFLASQAVKDNFLHAEGQLSNMIKDWIGDYYEHFMDGKHKVFLDKTPRYYKVLPVLINLFPESKFIILKRNPLRVAESIMRTWNRKDAYSLALNHYEDLCTAPYIIESFQSKKQNRNIHVTSYEDLLLEPKETVKAIFKFINVDFEDRFMNPSSNTKVNGVLGDPKNSSKYLLPTKIDKNGELNSWETAFIKGYSYKLGEIFLSQYGYIPNFNPQKTPEFELFQLIQEISSGCRNLSIGTILHLLKFKAESKIKGIIRQ